MGSRVKSKSRLLVNTNTNVITMLGLLLIGLTVVDSIAYWGSEL